VLTEERTKLNDCKKGS